MNYRLTNTHKHFGLMLAVGLLAWLFAYIGEAEMLQYIEDNNLDIVEVEQ